MTGIYNDRIPLLATLDTNGDGTGSTNANGNYSIGSPGIFFIQPPPNEIYVIHRLTLVVADKKIEKSGSYGDINGGLANGVLLDFSDDHGVIESFTSNNREVKNNLDMVKYFNEYQLVPFMSGSMISRSVFTLDTAMLPIRLDGGRGTKLTVTCRDNLTGLDLHNFIVQGYR